MHTLFASKIPEVSIAHLSLAWSFVLQLRAMHNGKLKRRLNLNTRTATADWSRPAGNRTALSLNFTRLMS